MTDPIRVKRIVDALSGRAATYVGKHGDHLKTSELLWAYLDHRYCNNWQINLEVVNDLVNLIKTPLTSVGALMEMPDKFNGLVNTIKTRNLDMDQVLQTMMFNLMPLDMKNEIVSKARVFYPQNQAFTWNEVSAQIFTVVSDYERQYAQNDPIDTMVFGKSCIIGSKPSKARRRNSTWNSGGGNNHQNLRVPRLAELDLHLLQDVDKNEPCIFCGGDHQFVKCNNSSLKAREEKLHALYRCPHCLFDHRSYNLYRNECSTLTLKCSCGCDEPSHLCTKSFPV